MKKKLIAICLCVALAAVAVVGASLAYFTDTKSATNTFTVGNVKIDLIESRFHRQGNDNSGDTSIPDPTGTASGMKYLNDGAKAFTDEEIKAAALPSAPMSSTPAPTTLTSVSASWFPPQPTMTLI